MRRLLLIAAMALVVRLVYLFELRDTALFAVPIGDGWQYDAWAKRIAAGDWIGGEPFYQAPLYPYFLAILYTIAGPDLWIVRLVQAFFGACSCLALGVAGREFFSERVGLAGATLLAVYPWAVFSDGLIQKSSLDLLLITALLACLGHFATTRQWGSLVASGVLFALLTLNRESTRALYPVLALWLIALDAVSSAPNRSMNVGLRRLGVFTGALVLVLLPVIARNYAVSGELMLSTFQMGPNFYIGNHRGASGTYEPLVEGRGSVEHEQEDATTLAERATGRRLSAGEVSSYWSDRALQYMKEQPAEWLRLTLRKALLTVNDAELSDSESLDVYATESVVLRAIRWLDFGVVFPIAVFGVWATRDQWRRLTVLYGIFTALALSVAAFFVFERYRVPMMPVVWLFAGAGLLALPRLRVMPLRQRIAGLSLVALTALVAHLPVVPVQADTTLFNVGLGLLKAGQPKAAIAVLEGAVAADAEDGAAHYALGVARDQSGDKPGALESFRTAVRVAPNDGQARSALALALQEAGQQQAALEQFVVAARLQPESAAVHTNLGAAQFDAGDLEGAVASFRESLRLRPDDALTRRNYGLVLQRLAAARLERQNVGEALRYAEEATRIDTESFQARYVLGQVHAAAGRLDLALSAFTDALALARRAGAAAEAARIEQVLDLLNAQLRNSQLPKRMSSNR